MVRKRKISKKVLFAKTVEVLQPILRLNEWQIKITFRKLNNKTLADCLPRAEYKSMSIRVNTDELKKYNDYDVICTAIHEMIHSLTSDLALWADELCKGDKAKLEITRKYEEALVSSFERIIGDLTIDILQDKLRNEGYPDLDLSFEKLKQASINTRKPKMKRLKG